MGSQWISALSTVQDGVFILKRRSSRRVAGDHRAVGRGLLVGGLPWAPFLRVRPSRLHGRVNTVELALPPSNSLREDVTAVLAGERFIGDWAEQMLAWRVKFSPQRRRQLAQRENRFRTL